MNTFSLRRKSQRVTRFLFVQCCALAGWIAVQLFFSLSPLGHAFSFFALMMSEAIWWMALLLIMLRLFLQEYNRFVQAALDLEDANRRLRSRTTNLLEQLRRAYYPEEERAANQQEAHSET